ncbi:MAG: class I tRNA ligase family protein [Candidatus Omnitrophica bacterium]|nr:class I tRNA ligase family protein [Candidatus Omnitrophota bacterium]
MDSYKFNEAANTLYSFFWHEFCDWYLEIIKVDIKDRTNQVVMYKVLEKFLRVLHPFMPFLTEEIWQRLPHEGSSIMTQPWPHLQEQMIDQKLEKEVEFIFNLVTQIRNLRSSIELEPQQKIKVSVYAQNKIKAGLLRDNSSLIVNLAGLEALGLLTKQARPSGTISTVVGEADVYLHFGGLLDIEKERQKIKAKIAELSKIVKNKIERLKNKDFIQRAPEEVVEKEREDATGLGNELKRLEKMLNELH